MRQRLWTEKNEWDIKMSANFKESTFLRKLTFTDIQVHYRLVCMRKLRLLSLVS